MHCSSLGCYLANGPFSINTDSMQDLGLPEPVLGRWTDDIDTACMSLVQHRIGCYKLTHMAGPTWPWQPPWIGTRPRLKLTLEFCHARPALLLVQPLLLVCQLNFVQLSPVFGARLHVSSIGIGLAMQQLPLGQQLPLWGSVGLSGAANSWSSQTVPGPAISCHALAGAGSGSANRSGLRSPGSGSVRGLGPASPTLLKKRGKGSTSAKKKRRPAPQDSSTPQADRAEADAEDVQCSEAGCFEPIAGDRQGLPIPRSGRSQVALCLRLA